jgi:hypothetical protein
VERTFRLPTSRSCAHLGRDREMRELCQGDEREMIGWSDPVVSLHHDPVLIWEEIGR